MEDGAQDLVVRRIGRLTTWAQPVLRNAAVVIRAGRVAWTGNDADLPAGMGDLPELDAAGAAVLPGFVDCHTHAVWAGDRRDELVARIAGESYAAGGIQTTVAATIAASDEALLAATTDRLSAMRRTGTTTVEIKSGYALTTPGELRLLRVAAAAAAAADLRADLTYLAAHVVPRGRETEEYVAEVTAALPEAAVAGARWCDVFCDAGAFTVDQARRILGAARAAGLGLRLHAEQLQLTGAARLAAEMHCASADHLEQVDAAGAAALAAAGTVAVVVPIAGLQTGTAGSGHLARLRQAGTPLALATDCNPGTGWAESMPLAIQLACWLWRLPVEAALRAATQGGARALQRDDIGHLGVGARGDLVVLEADHEAEVAVHLAASPVRETVVSGRTRRR